MVLATAPSLKVERASSIKKEIKKYYVWKWSGKGLNAKVKIKKGWNKIYSLKKYVKKIDAGIKCQQCCVQI